MKTSIPCPACAQPLHYEIPTKMLFCAHGPCRSLVANDGIEVAAEVEALKGNDLDSMPDEVQAAVATLKSWIEAED